MKARRVALLREIDVGRAKRIAVADLRALVEELWTPEALAIEADAVHLWLPEGVMASEIPKAVERATGNAITTRNRRTLERIRALL